MSFENDNWINYDNLTICGWLKINDMIGHNSILSVKESSEFMITKFPRVVITSDYQIDDMGHEIKITQSSLYEWYGAQLLFDNVNLRAEVALLNNKIKELSNGEKN
jgi:hypothetical protein